MLSQLSNAQNFVNNYLLDVIDWKKDMLPANDPSLKDRIDRDLRVETTGDQAHIVLKTNYNMYYLSFQSVYMEPPHDAPLQCKMLGTIIFQELTTEDPVRWVKPRQDQSMIDISKQIRRDELWSCVKDVRRQMAECSNPELMGILQGRIPALAAKAHEFGLDIRGLLPQIQDPQFPPVKMPDMQVGEVVKQVVEATRLKDKAEAVEVRAVAIPVPEGLYIGCPVIYITNPGEAISGTREIPGIVNKIYPGGMISGIFFPDHSEVMHKDQLFMKDGRITFNCWEFNPGYKDLLTRYAEIDRLRSEAMDRITKLEGDVIEMHNRLNALDRATGDEVAKLKDMVLEVATRPAPEPKAKKDK